MKIFIVIFSSLLLTNFFGATEINNTLLLLILIPFVLIEIRKKAMFKKYLIAVFLGIFLSIVSCYYFNGQSMFTTFRSSAPFLYILFYFMLKNLDLSIQEMETALFILVIIFVLCYTVQYIVYPISLFQGGAKEYKDDIRIRLMGQGFCSLGYFLGLNKYLIRKNYKYQLVAIFCFCIILLMGFRTMLAMIVLLTIIMVIRTNGFSWKFIGYSVMVCGLYIFLLQFPVFADKVDNMLARQETEVFSNPNYIRVVEIIHFTQRHFKNTWEYIFGSGLPFVPESGVISDYSRYMQSLVTAHIYWVDLGLLGLSWIIGIPAVIAMIAYSVKTFLLKVSSEYYYIGIWFIYLLLISFTTMEFFRPGNFVVQAIALYIVEKVHEESLNIPKAIRN